MPITFRLLPGSINDVITLKQLLDQFDKLELPRVHLVMDRGFYSQDNLDTLFGMRRNFTMGIPVHLKWVRSQIDQHRHLINGPYGLKTFEGEQIYTYTLLHAWGKDIVLSSENKVRHIKIVHDNLRQIDCLKSQIFSIYT